MTARVFSSDMLVEAIAHILREDGWTCEYHAPASSRGECGQCDRAHDATARRLAAMAIPTKPLALPTMNPMTQEPDASIEAVVLKKRVKSQYDLDGYSLGMRFPYHDGTIWWGIIDSECNEETLSGFSSDFEGWWPLDIRSAITE